MGEKTFIVDCDGVLYPTSQLSLRDFVEAMKKTYRNNVNLDSATQKRVSQETTEKKHLGMFNYINAICKAKNYSFETFCAKMQDYIDYSKITEDKTMLQALLAVSAHHNVIILTNNHIGHLNKVTQQRFNKSVFELEAMGIKCFDITTTQKNGIFYPKQTPEALLLFAKELNLDVKDCVLVDDSPRNISVAKSVGMDGALISPELTLTHYLRQQIPNTFTINLGKENA